jgi:zinc metalloprotease ZmpB
VPNDNNIGQRNVHPVDNQLDKVAWEKLPFWVRNHGKKPVRLSTDIKLPTWLSRLGWSFSVPQITKETVARPAQLLKVNLAFKKGKPFDESVLARETDHDIVATVLHDGMPAGGMTFRVTAGRRPQLTADNRDGVARSRKAPARTRVAARKARTKRTA